MPIPKTIYQTYKSKGRLPYLTQLHIYQMKKNNPAYDYQFYDDEKIEEFVWQEFGPGVFTSYQKINIGAAKADFFRYAILYKKGGVYLDIDSLFLDRLDNIVFPEDRAVISFEQNLTFYIQYALFFEAKHPYLEETLNIILKNIEENKYPNDVHKMTGPTAYTLGINKCIEQNGRGLSRQMGMNYESKVKFSYPMSKFFLYGLSRKNHWKTLSKTQGVLK